MKLATRLLSLPLALVLFTGCEKPAETAGTDQTNPASTPAPAAPTASEPAAPPAAPPATAGETLQKAAESVLGQQARNLQPAAPAVPAEGAGEPAVAKMLGAVNEQLASGNADWSGALKSAVSGNTDTMLASLGGEIGRAAASLKQSFDGNAGLTEALNNGLRAALSGEGKSSEVLGLYDQLTAAGLTEEQKRLAKEVGNLTSAFVAQKNLSALDGADGQVAQLVNSLRKGDVKGVVPVAKDLATNAKLTPAQKDLLQGLSEKYAPALKDLTGKLPTGGLALPPNPQ
ncbi:MAG: hypothetical protein H7A47_14455 [Verrucomicrobiales bacterium]|nr:hypothetical protein [Verrucomicrobiales bacterium]